MSHTKLRPGDVLEVSTSDGLGYVQYIGEHDEFGGTIWALPRLVPERPADLSTLPWEAGYFAFYPARAGVQRQFATIVGSIPLEGRMVPTRWRRAGARAGDGRVITWMVSDHGTEIMRESLGKEELRLPVASIWNHEMLVHRLQEGWRPESAA